MEIAQPIAQPIASELAVGISNGLFGNVGFNTLAFHALTYDPVTFEVLPVKTGIGDLTEARTGAIEQYDHENIWRSFASGVPAWVGGRVVENVSLNSQTPSAWSVVGTVTVDSLVASDPKGGNLAMTASFGATGIANRIALGRPASTSGQPHIHSIWLRGAVGGESIRLGEIWGGSAVLTLTTSWKRYSFPFTSNVYTEIIIYANSGTPTVGIFGGQTENATGRTDTTTPSEYIPTQGSAVQKVFVNTNGNTVSSNSVTEATGPILASLPNMYSGPAGTNEIQYSRDLTNAAWLKRGTAAVTYNQIGMSGAANTASLVSGISTGNNDTFILIAVGALTASAGSAVRVFIRGVAGTGSLGLFNPISPSAGDWTIDMTKISTSNFEEITEDHIAVTVNVAFSAFTDGSGGIHFRAKTGTVGDFIVGNVDVYDNTTIDKVRKIPPIVTSGAAASIVASDDSFSLSNHTPDQGLYFLPWSPQFSASEATGNIEILSLNNAAGLLYYDATNNLLKSTDGTNTASVALTIVAGVTYKIWLAYGQGSLQVGVDALTGTAASFDGAFTTGTKIELATPAARATFTRDIEHYNLTFAAGVIRGQALSA